jgi:putative IMPACT (imprinted ancient) family translation regulator
VAERRLLVELREVGFCCAFDDLGSVHAALPAHGAEKIAEDFNETGAVLRISLPAGRVDALKTHLRDATRNRVRFAESDTE